MRYSGLTGLLDSIFLAIRKAVAVRKYTTNTTTHEEHEATERRHHSYQSNTVPFPSFRSFTSSVALLPQDFWAGCYISLQSWATPYLSFFDHLMTPKLKSGNVPLRRQQGTGQYEHWAGKAEIQNGRRLKPEFTCLGQSNHSTMIFLHCLFLLALARPIWRHWLLNNACLGCVLGLI